MVSLVMYQSVKKAGNEGREGRRERRGRSESDNKERKGGRKMKGERQREKCVGKQPLSLIYCCGF